MIVYGRSNMQAALDNSKGFSPIQQKANSNAALPTPDLKNKLPGKDAKIGTVAADNILQYQSLKTRVEKPEGFQAPLSCVMMSP
jgi:hypothetical protein